MKINIFQVIRSLAQRRPIFHSEADFQHAFAWQIREIYPEIKPRLEWRAFANERLCVDIWLPEANLAIELKYLTRKIEIECAGEAFNLANQAAHDIRRYDFICDVERLERISKLRDEKPNGIAILITNDPSHWKAPKSVDTVDANFRIYEGRVVSGALSWSTSAGSGTTKGRERPISLANAYSMNWQDYSNLGSTSASQFRFIAIPVLA